MPQNKMGVAQLVALRRNKDLRDIAPPPPLHTSTNLNTKTHPKSHTDARRRDEGPKQPMDAANTLTKASVSPWTRVACQGCAVVRFNSLHAEYALPHRAGGPPVLWAALRTLAPTTDPTTLRIQTWTYHLALPIRRQRWQCIWG